MTPGLKLAVVMFIAFLPVIGWGAFEARRAYLERNSVSKAPAGK